jgi:hypothetical protein
MQRLKKRHVASRSIRRTSNTKPQTATMHTSIAQDTLTM